MIQNNTQALAHAMAALTLIATPRRPDGTYNRDRHACEQLARETMADLEAFQGMPAARPAAAQAVSANVGTSSAVPSVGTGPAEAMKLLTPAPPVVSGSEFTVNCDGASKANPGHSAWGVAIQSADGSVLLAEANYLGLQTNQVAELMAALEGLRRTPAGATVLLRSDSEYTLKGIDDWRHKWARNGWLTSDRKPVKNQEIWRQLAIEADLRKVTIQWVKGHSGDPMNELCDTLANEAVAARGKVVR